MDSAAASGHLDLVKWLHEHRPEGCTTKAMDSAAAYGHLEIVKWLHANRLEGCTVKAMSNAAGSGHLEVLQWLFADRCEGFTDMAISKAALGGHLTVVQWLLSKKEPSAVYRRRTIKYAAASGSLHVLQYVCTKFPGDVNVSTIVRRGGKHLGTLQWLYERYPDQFDHAEVMNIVQEHHSKPHILAWLKSIHPRGWKRKSRK